MNNQKNYTLELLKLITSYMVVFIHVKFYGEMGIAIETLARFAVPLFFLISGYYSYQIKPEKILKRAKNILNLSILAVGSYTVFNIVTLLLKGRVGRVFLYFAKYLNITKLFKLVVFNVSISAGHLWFLLALIYVYLVFYWMTVSRFNEKAMFILSFLLLGGHLLLGEGLSMVGIRLPLWLVRNFALMGLPFFVLGLFTRKHENKLHNIPNYALIILAVIGGAEAVISRHLFGRNEMYIGSMLILFALVVWFIKYANVQYPAFINALSGCSTYIYIFHVMISSVILGLYKLFAINYEASIGLQNIHPILVCIASTALAYGMKQRSLKKQKEHKNGRKNLWRS
ncbi:MAG: acyltransferase family protein [Clostridia bacterium]|nr:acyltransferase family protein [Clostridia bacterium]